MYVMKKHIMKPLAIAAGFLAGLGLNLELFAEFRPATKLPIDPVTYGCTIVLRHERTGKYLMADNQPYNHWGSSRQPAVYGGSDTRSDYARWVITGPHSHEKRWNSVLAKEEARRCEWGTPLRVGSLLRLENVATGRKLHSHSPFPSPTTGQGETTNWLQIGNSDDDFQVESVDVAGGGKYVAHGKRFKLRHVNSNRTLHSHPNEWRGGKQEVTTYAGRDDNDYWIAEIISTPNENNVIEGAYNSSRQFTINYWTPIFIDSDNFDVAPDLSRVWTHADSRLPGSHRELLVGANSGDARPRQGPALFLIQNADNPAQVGPVQWGDRIKILATWAGAGDNGRAGLIKPFAVWWVNDTSRWGAGYREVLISSVDDANTQSDNAVFTLEPLYDTQTGPVSVNDVARIKNIGKGAYLWVHPSSRFGGRFYEILVNKLEEDKWGRDNLGFPRFAAYERFRMTPVSPLLMKDEDGKSHFRSVIRSSGLLTPDQVKRIEEQATAAAAASVAALRAANEAAAKLAADAAAAAEKAAKDLQEAKAKAASDLSAAQAELAAAKSQAEKDLAAARLEEANKLAEAQTKAAKDLADEAAAKAAIQKQLEETRQAKADFEKEAAKNLDAAQQAARAEAQRVAAMAADMEHAKDLPVGFVKRIGTAKAIALGLQDRDVEKTVDNKGTKQTVKEYDDMLLTVQEDGSLVRYDRKVKLSNPWVRVPLRDSAGKDIKVSSAAIGMDGTTVVISDDGKSFYMIGWPDDTPPAMPQPSKGFQIADAKKEISEEKKARRKDKKAGQRKSKHGKAKKDGKKKGKNKKGKNKKSLND